MYTIIMNADKSLSATSRPTLYQYEKLSDKIQFLFPQTYEEVNIKNCTAVIKYLDPANVPHIEVLQMDEELYKENYVRCVMPIDTKFTKFAGEISLHITFISINSESELREEILHTGETSITIRPLKDYYAFTPDESLNAIDQMLAKTAATVEAAKMLAESIDINKADDLSFEDNVLQLISNGRKIGTAHTISGAESPSEAIQEAKEEAIKISQQYTDETISDALKVTEFE